MPTDPRHSQTGGEPAAAPGETPTPVRPHPLPESPQGALDAIARRAADDLSGQACLARFAEILAAGEYGPASFLRAGGMGQISEAWQRSLERPVGIKEPKPGAPIDRFVREAVVTGMLQHPSIVPVHAIRVVRGPDGKLHVSIVMKLVTGATLRGILNCMANPGRAWDESHGDERRAQQLIPSEQEAALPFLLNILQRVCDAVQYAHRHPLRIIHRDIKPENIMVGDDGEVLLMDWGIAKVLNHSAAQDSDLADLLVSGADPAVTAANGTGPYMPADSEVTEAVDIFALGCVLYECLRFARANELTASQQAAVAHLSAEQRPRYRMEQFRENARTGQLGQAADTFGPACPRWSRRALRALVPVAMRSLAPHADARYSDAREFREELRRFSQGQPTKAQRPGPLDRLAFAVARNPLAAILALAFVLLGAAGIVWAASAIGKQRDVAQGRLDRILAMTSTLDESLEKIVWTAAAGEINHGTDESFAGLIRSTREVAAACQPFFAVPDNLRWEGRIANLVSNYELRYGTLAKADAELSLAESIRETMVNEHPGAKLLDPSGSVLPTLRQSIRWWTQDTVADQLARGAERERTSGKADVWDTRVEWHSLHVAWREVLQARSMNDGALAERKIRQVDDCLKAIPESEMLKTQDLSLLLMVCGNCLSALPVTSDPALFARLRGRLESSAEAYFAAGEATEQQLEWVYSGLAGLSNALQWRARNAEDLAAAAEPGLRMLRHVEARLVQNPRQVKLLYYRAAGLDALLRCHTTSDGKATWQEHERRKRLDEHIEAWREAAEADPQRTLLQDRLAEALLLRAKEPEAQSAELAKDLEDAVACCRQILSRRKDRPYTLLSVAERLNDAAEAAEEKDALTEKALAWADESIAHLRRVCKTHPELHEAPGVLCSALVTRADLLADLEESKQHPAREEAMRQLEQATADLASRMDSATANWWKTAAEWRRFALLFDLWKQQGRRGDGEPVVAAAMDYVEGLIASAKDAERSEVTNRFTFIARLWEEPLLAEQATRSLLKLSAGKSPEEQGLAYEGLAGIWTARLKEYPDGEAVAEPVWQALLNAYRIGSEIYPLLDAGSTNGAVSRGSLGRFAYELALTGQALASPSGKTADELLRRTEEANSILKGSLTGYLEAADLHFGAAAESAENSTERQQWLMEQLRARVWLSSKTHGTEERVKWCEMALSLADQCTPLTEEVCLRRAEVLDYWHSAILEPDEGKSEALGAAADLLELRLENLWQWRELARSRNSSTNETWFRKQAQKVVESAFKLPGAMGHLARVQIFLRRCDPGLDTTALVASALRDVMGHEDLKAAAGALPVLTETCLIGLSSSLADGAVKSARDYLTVVKVLFDACREVKSVPFSILEAGAAVVGELEPDSPGWRERAVLRLEHDLEIIHTLLTDSDFQEGLQGETAKVFAVKAVDSRELSALLLKRAGPADADAAKCHAFSCGVAGLAIATLSSDKTFARTLLGEAAGLKQKLDDDLRAGLEEILSEAWAIPGMGERPDQAN